MTDQAGRALLEAAWDMDNLNATRAEVQRIGGKAVDEVDADTPAKKAQALQKDRCPS